MSEHKHNPTAFAAKNGELPPKPKPIGKREAERLLMYKIRREIERRTGIYSALRSIKSGGADHD